MNKVYEVNIGNKKVEVKVNEERYVCIQCKQEFNRNDLRKFEDSLFNDQTFYLCRSCTLNVDIVRNKLTK